MSFCAVILVLLLDVSGSIGHDDWLAQREHTAAALEDPQVMRAIRSEGPVAVRVLGFDMQVRSMVPWRVVQTESEAQSLAAEVRAAPRPGNGGTDIGAAVIGALTEIAAAPCTAERQVVDISTDGEANAVSANIARDQAMIEGVTVNAIAVGNDAVQAGQWLRANAVTPSGFVLETGSWADYPALLRRKLVMELSQR